MTRPGPDWIARPLGALPGTQGPGQAGECVPKGVSADGRVVVGANLYSIGNMTGFVWTEARGLMSAAEFLAAVGVSLPDGFLVSQFTAVSADGRVIAGYGTYAANPGGSYESFLVHLDGVASVPVTPTGAGPVLGANYPNPFNPTTSIALSLPATALVEVEVLDIRGRRVRMLHDGELAAGHHVLRWDGCDDRGLPLGSGVYFARVRDRHGSTASRRMTLVK